MLKISKLKKYKFKTVFLYGRYYYYFSKTEKTKTKYRIRYLNNGSAVVYSKEKELLECVESGYLSILHKEFLVSDIKHITKENNEENIKKDIYVLKEFLYVMYGV